MPLSSAMIAEIVAVAIYPLKLLSLQPAQLQQRLYCQNAPGRRSHDQFGGERAFVGRGLKGRIDQNVAVQTSPQAHGGASPYLSSSVIVPTR